VRGRVDPEIHLRKASVMPNDLELGEFGPSHGLAPTEPFRDSRHGRRGSLGRAGDEVPDVGLVPAGLPERHRSPPTEAIAVRAALTYFWMSRSVVASVAATRMRA